MNISFTPLTRYYTFTGKQAAQKLKDERVADTFEKKKDDIHEKISDKRQIDNFVEFYLGIEDEDSRKMLRYCLEDDEERYGDILDKLDEAEGIDRNIKEKRSFTRKLLDFMMLSEFFDIDARWEAAELAKLPFFDDENNKYAQDILLELAAPYMELINSINEENEEKEAEKTNTNAAALDGAITNYKPKKLGVFKRAAALFTTKMPAK